MSSYGCHPASDGICDCDWETDDHGHDYFSQCETCADLWEKDPGASWGVYDAAAADDSDDYEQESLRADSEEALIALNYGNLYRAIEIVLERNLLWRSPVLLGLFKDWVPKLLECPDAIDAAGIGGLLEECAARVT